MGKVQFTVGQRVYNNKGQSARYVRPMMSGGHLVAPLIVLGGFDDEYETTLDYTTWPEVFDSPPQAPAWVFWLALAFLVICIAGIVLLPKVMG